MIALWLLLALALFPALARAACTDTGLGQSITISSLARSGEVNPALNANSCSGCDSSGVVTYTFNFSCNGGDCTCGQYVTGDFWILDPNPAVSSAEASSVQFDSESPNTRSCTDGIDDGIAYACNGIVLNPGVNANGWDERSEHSTHSPSADCLANGNPYQCCSGLDAGTCPTSDNFGPSYSSGSNVAAGTYLDATTANGATSLVKAFSWRPDLRSFAAAGCGPGSNGHSTHSYFVITVVATAPSATAFRPPFSRTTKPAASVGATPAWSDGAVNYSIIPTFDMLARTSPPSYARAYRQVAMPQVDTTRSPGGGGQSTLAIVNSSGTGNHCPAYGEHVGAERARSFYLTMDDAGLDVDQDAGAGVVTRRMLIRAWVQTGIDIYGTASSLANPLTDEGIWMPSGGHGIGRKLPLVFAATLLNDTTLRQFVKDIVDATDGTTAFNKMFSDDGVAYFGAAANRALYGELCTNHSPGTVSANSQDWWTQAGGNNQYCRDPEGRIDGGTQQNALGSAYPYNAIAPGGAAAGLWLFPQLREIWDYDPFWQLADRLYGYDTFSGDGGNGGWLGDDGGACSNLEETTHGSAPYCTALTGALTDCSNSANALRCCGGSTCTSQHGDDGVPWGSINTTTFAEDVYADLRDCPNTPGAGGCTGYLGLTPGDTVSCTSWCTGPECPSCTPGTPRRRRPSIFGELVDELVAFLF